MILLTGALNGLPNFITGAITNTGKKKHFLSPVEL